MAEGGAPPPAAMRGGMGTGIVAVIAVVVLVVGFVGGIFAAPVIFPPASPDVLVVGTNTPFTPFEFRNEDGALVGFTIDLVEEIANRAGLTVEWRDFNIWESLLLAGQTGAVDMIASSMTITAERDVVYDFSNSYYSANQAVLVPTSSTLTCADNTCTATDMMDLTWVVQTGTTSNIWVTDTLGENCATGGPLFCFGDVATVLNTV
ncbi:MAG: transporter substrate-binding domain-containing protein, partial [Thermoplasmata archaeon]